MEVSSRIAVRLLWWLVASHHVRHWILLRKLHRENAMWTSCCICITQMHFLITDSSAAFLRRHPRILHNQVFMTAAVCTIQTLQSLLLIATSPTNVKLCCVFKESFNILNACCGVWKIISFIKPVLVRS